MKREIELEGFDTPPGLKPPGCSGSPSAGMRSPSQRRTAGRRCPRPLDGDALARRARRTKHGRTRSAPRPRYVEAVTRGHDVPRNPRNSMPLARGQMSTPRFAHHREEAVMAPDTRATARATPHRPGQDPAACGALKPNLVRLAGSVARRPTRRQRGHPHTNEGRAVSP